MRRLMTAILALCALEMDAQVATASHVVWFRAQQWTAGVGADNRTYAIVLADEPWGWREAQSLAVTVGGTLAATPNNDTLAFVVALASDANAFNCAGPWIGGYQFSNQSWQWTNGASFAPFAWAVGRPIQSTLLDAAICLGGVDEPDGTWIDALPDSDTGVQTRSAVVVLNSPTDCNANGAPDSLEIAVTPTIDADHDGRIDSCPPDAPSADLNGDGRVNGVDLTILLTNFGGAGPDGDVNDDGVVNGLDLAFVLGGWSP